MTWSVTSPDGRTGIAVGLDDAGRAAYRVTRDGREVISASRLGVERADTSFAEGLTAAEAPGGPTAIDETYAVGHGKRSTLRSRATALTIALRNADGARVDIDLRAFDDGVAFRYRFPADDPAGAAATARPLTVTGELTAFRLAGEGRAWLQPTQQAGHFGPAHENLYLDGVPIGTPSPTRSWELPATFVTGGTWALVTEAGLDRTFHGSRLSGRPEGRCYGLVGPDPGEGNGLGPTTATSTPPWTLPWRAVVLADTAAGLLESSLVTHLAEPGRLADTSWVRPGRASWSWWADNDSPRNLDALRGYVDLAAEMGWEYSLVDANWDVHPEERLRDLVRYAGDRGVAVLLWYNSGGPHNTVTEGPRDRMHNPAARRAELARIASWGVAGIKVDFFHSDKQDGIGLYLGILEDAARAGLLVNFHGCTIPRGWERTWPHLMTMEAVRGAEIYLADPGYAADAVTHNTILPFTRNVIGPMDYTPVTFSDRLAPRRTTAAHELALAVVFESGLLHYADSPAAYRAQHPAVLQALRQIPAAWDETIGLAGEPGSHVVLARRSGPTWYLAGLTGPRPRPAEVVDLGRLGGAAGSWRMIADGGPRDEVTVEDVAGDGAGLRIPATPAGGGFLAMAEGTA